MWMTKKLFPQLSSADINNNNNNDTMKDELDVPIHPTSFNDFIIVFEQVKHTSEAAYEDACKLDEEEEKNGQQPSSESYRHLIKLITTFNTETAPAWLDG